MLFSSAARQKLVDYIKGAKHTTMFDFVTKGILQVGGAVQAAGRAAVFWCMRGVGGALLAGSPACATACAQPAGLPIPHHNLT